MINLNLNYQKNVFFFYSLIVIHVQYTSLELELGDIREEISSSLVQSSTSLSTLSFCVGDQFVEEVKNNWNLISQQRGGKNMKLWHEKKLEIFVYVNGDLSVLAKNEEKCTLYTSNALLLGRWYLSGARHCERDNGKSFG